MRGGKQTLSPTFGLTGFPLLQHIPFEQAGQLSKIRLRLQVEDEVQYGVVSLLVHDAGDNTPVFSDHLVLRQRIAGVALGARTEADNVPPPAKVTSTRAGHAAGY